MENTEDSIQYPTPQEPRPTLQELKEHEDKNRHDKLGIKVNEKIKRFKEVIKEYYIKLKSFLKECNRTIKITKKPEKEEYKTIAKVTAIGIVIIGIIGGILAVIATLLGV